MNTQLLAPASESANQQTISATGLSANIQSLPSEVLTHQKVHSADRADQLSKADVPKDKLSKHQLLGSTVAQTSALKLVDPQSLQDLQTHIDKVHSNLDKLAPSVPSKTFSSAFASLVLETRLPTNHQLRQKPSDNLPEASQATVLPAFEKNLQSLADEPLKSSDATPPHAADELNKAMIASEKIASDVSAAPVIFNALVNSEMAATAKPEAIKNDTTMLSNLTHAIHSDDVWVKKGQGSNEWVPPVPFFKTTLPVANEVTKVDAVSAVEAVLIDGSVDWKILLLLIVFFSMPVVMFGRGLLYPAQICQGTGQLERRWMQPGSDNSAILINEESVSLSHSIQFSPSHVLLDGQRFPFYKELNQTSHFAEATSAGIKGSFNTHGIAKTRYTFVYDQAIQELRIDKQSTGMGTLEGRVGLLEENTSFTGRCANDWF